VGKTTQGKCTRQEAVFKKPYIRNGSMGNITSIIFKGCVEVFGMKRPKARSIWVMLGLILVLGSSSAFAEQPEEDRDIREFIETLYKARAELLVHGDAGLISDYYVNGEGASMHAKGLELKRSRYIRTWAEHRNLTFISAEPAIRIVRLNKEHDTVRISLVQSLKLTYQYDDPMIAPQHFGVGTRHSIKLRKTGDRWVVINEWYLDPFDENPDLIPSFRGKKDDLRDYAASIPDQSLHTGKKSQKRFNREQAIAYSNKYAGIAWGAGNNNRYNRKYRDYTGIGGDCTNFVSQVIGDPTEGGGIPMTHGWRYGARSGGSVSWVRTDQFKSFVLHSGYGRLVARGTYADIMKNAERTKNASFHGMLPGDLIAYEMDGDIDHFAVYMGLDDNGYPLVNCHTADRYRAPFDLGWDKNTRYWLIHMID